MDLTPQTARGSNCRQGSEKALFYWLFGAVMTDTPAKDRNPTEIEITPEMTRAGAEIIWASFSETEVWGSSSGPSVAISVFLAMCAARDGRSIDPLGPHAERALRKF